MNLCVVISGFFGDRPGILPQLADLLITFPGISLCALSASLLIGCKGIQQVHATAHSPFTKSSLFGGYAFPCIRVIYTWRSSHSRDLPGHYQKFRDVPLSRSQRSILAGISDGGLLISSCPERCSASSLCVSCPMISL